MIRYNLAIKYLKSLLSTNKSTIYLWLMGDITKKLSFVSQTHL